MIPTPPFVATKKRSCASGLTLNICPLVVVPIPTPVEGRTALVVTLRPAKVETPEVTFEFPSTRPLPEALILPVTLPTRSPVKLPAINEFAVHTPVIATLPVIDNLSVGFVRPIP